MTAPVLATWWVWPAFLTVRGNDAVNDAQHPPHDLGPAGKQETQLKREAQHPLTHGLFRQYFINQQGGTFGHPPRPTARAETATLTAESDRARRGKTRSEPVESHAPAARIGEILQIPLHIARQFLSLLCHKRSECRVILVNDLIEKGLLGSVALVTTSIPIPAGRLAAT